MWDFLFRQSIGFFNRYRSRITIGAIIAIAAAVYYTFFYQPSLNDKRKASVSSESGRSGRRLDLVEMRTLSSNPQAGLKARLLLRIRKQFDSSIRIFLPTLRKAVFDLIDISQPVRQIKTLRASTVSSLNQMEMEAQLWEEVKISSFTMLFVSTYVLCGLTTVLKVQLHVLARAILRGEGPALESLGASPENAEEAAIYAKDSALLRKLIDGTFRHMFGPGLQRLADLIRSRLQVLLRDWVVKERMRVEFEDILRLLNMVRRDFESDFDPVIRSLLYDSADRSLTFSLSSSSRSDKSTPRSRREDPRAEKLLMQIRLVIDNPLFSVVYRESVDAAFRMVVDNLRRFVFLSSDTFSPTASTHASPIPLKTTDSRRTSVSGCSGRSSPSVGTSTSPAGTNNGNGATGGNSTLSSPSPNASGSLARRASQTSSPAPISPTPLHRTPSMSGSGMSIVKKTPPLASILPQLKSLSGKLLPETADAVNPYDLKSLTSGPLLESFCMTIFDAEDMTHVL